jgi:uncharacterized surface protein with fasciclin (FAS1) repeats
MTNNQALEALPVIGAYDILSEVALHWVALWKKGRLWIVLSGAALASAYVQRSDAARPPTYLASPPVIFPDLRRAVQSSSDLNMIQNLAASVRGVERFFSPNARFTVFAPRNIAFAGIPRSFLNEMWKPGNQLWPKVFWHHATTGAFKKQDLSDGQLLKQLDGETVRIAFKEGVMTVDDAPVIGTLHTGSSVIYVVDSLLIPPSSLQEFSARKSGRNPAISSESH